MHIKEEADGTSILLTLECETRKRKVDLRPSGFKGILSRIANHTDYGDIIPVLLLKCLGQRILIFPQELLYPCFIDDGDLLRCRCVARIEISTPENRDA